MIVADTNLVCYLYLTGQHTAKAEAALRKDPEWVAPWLWRSEFRSALSLYLRKGLLTLAEGLAICQDAEELMAGREHPVAAHDVLAMVAASPCSAYDCEFVALARLLGVRLVTTDSQVLHAFPETAVSLDQFV